MYQALFNNNFAMATVDVAQGKFVFKMKAYKYILKVTKFQLPTAYHFSTVEGKSSLWADSALGLLRVKGSQVLNLYSSVFLSLMRLEFCTEVVRDHFCKNTSSFII